MNDVVPHAPQGALTAAGAPVARMSHSLSAVLAIQAEPVAKLPGSGDPKDPGMLVARPPAVVTKADVEEAAWHASRMAPLLAPVVPDAIRQWLTTLNAGVAQPVDEATFAARVAAIAIACEGMPIGAFTLAAKTEAFRTFKWFPTAPEVFSLVKPHAEALERQAVALRHVADTPSAQWRAPPKADVEPDALPDGDFDPSYCVGVTEEERAHDRWYRYAERRLRGQVKDVQPVRASVKSMLSLLRARSMPAWMKFAFLHAPKLHKAEVESAARIKQDRALAMAQRAADASRAPGAGAPR